MKREYNPPDVTAQILSLIVGGDNTATFVKLVAVALDNSANPSSVTPLLIIARNAKPNVTVYGPSIAPLSAVHWTLYAAAGNAMGITNAITDGCGMQTALPDVLWTDALTLKITTVEAGLTQIANTVVVTEEHPYIHNPSRFKEREKQRETKRKRIDPSEES